MQINHKYKIRIGSLVSNIAWVEYLGTGLYNDHVFKSFKSSAFVKKGEKIHLSDFKILSEVINDEETPYQQEKKEVEVKKALPAVPFNENYVFKKDENE